MNNGLWNSQHNRLAHSSHIGCCVLSQLLQEVVKDLQCTYDPPEDTHHFSPDTGDPKRADGLQHNPGVLPYCYTGIAQRMAALPMMTEIKGAEHEAIIFLCQVNMCLSRSIRASSLFVGLPQASRGHSCKGP